MKTRINRTTLSKFRIYDEKYRSWSKEPLLVYPDVPILKQGHVIQWWTGLVDVNSKEIYEGDIVRTVNGGLATIFGACQYTRGEVKWLREAFCICQTYVGGNEISNYVNCDCCTSPLEVIGNIFDNPELLEECPVAKQMREERTN
jgi:uncharacterized phage protein (TIGR01671 family)